MTLEQLIVEALARRFGRDTAPNPTWDRKAARAAHLDDRDYEVPEHVPATLDQMRDGTPMIVFTAADGLPAIRSASLAEVTEVVLDALPPWHFRDDTGLVWRLPAEGCGIEGSMHRLTHVDDRKGTGS